MSIIPFLPWVLGCMIAVPVLLLVAVFDKRPML